MVTDTQKVAPRRDATWRWRILLFEGIVAVNVIGGAGFPKGFRRVTRRARTSHRSVNHRSSSLITESERVRAIRRGRYKLCYARCARDNRGEPSADCPRRCFMTRRLDGFRCRVHQLRPICTDFSPSPFLLFPPRRSSCPLIAFRVDGFVATRPGKFAANVCASSDSGAN